MTITSNDLEFLVLEDISCVDADGTVFEQYDRLEVAKDVFRDNKGVHMNFTPHAGAVYSEERGLFLPSFALTCNILAALYAGMADVDFARVLQQYIDTDCGCGWHAQNTLVAYGTEEVVHYPTATDFGEQGAVNLGQRRTPLGFDKTTLQNALLKDALRAPASLRFVRQLTGLEDPRVLVEIGKYFEKPARLWFPWSSQDGSTYHEKRAAWVGCNYDNLDLNCDYSLYNYVVARGVRRASGAPEARP